MGGGRRLVAAALAALAAALLAAPAANADFHFISIREVHPDSTTHADSAYVVLQAYASGQNFVYNHSVTTHAADGSTTGTFTFPGYPYYPGNGANQMTILVGDTGVSSAFGVTPDLADAGFSLNPAGGAVCWAGSTDCMSWGDFTGSISGTGSPAAPSGIPEGMALRRTIAPNCSTLLELGDDSNDSATDFFSASPAPRNNSSPITETDCTGPSVVIDTKPANPTSSTSASFTYHSVPAGASFECRLDAAIFSSCPSAGVTYSSLSEGNHSFQVRGEDASEQVGTPATYGWRVDTIAPTATIGTKPVDPSHGGSVQFKYQASESGSSFECSLAAGAAPDDFASCPSSGKSYNDLPDGEHTFKVRAEDPAGNTGASAAHTWTVDNSLADTTPPDTVIDSGPPDPTTSSTVSFTYHSTESGSSFECKLDAAAFAGCPTTGVTYGGLVNGSHTFFVRAIDADENVDPTPAGRTFDVAVPSPPPSPPPPPPPPLLAAPAIPTPPETRLVKKPPRVTRDRTPTVRFGSNVRGARFQCSVDRERFRTCSSPFTTKRLKFGRHRIRVRAIVGGAVDPTPAVTGFKVAKSGRNNRRARKGKRRQRRAGGARSQRRSLGERG